MKTSLSLTISLAFGILPVATFGFTAENDSEWIRGEYIAKLKEKTSIKTLESLNIQGFQTTVLSSELGFIRITAPQSDSDKKDLANLEQNPNFEYVEKNYSLKLIDNKIPHHAVPRVNTPQWALEKIEAEKAWQHGTGSIDVIVAVVDTGIDFEHYELVGRLWSGKNARGETIHGYNAISNDNQARDDHGHGTHVAGVIGANPANNNGIKGLNWKLRLMGIKFLNKEGSGSTASAIKGLEWAVKNGAQILNNSWGGGAYSRALNDTIRWIEEQGVLFVAAAGNEKQNLDSTPSYPASYGYKNMIVVAALDEKNRLASFSNYGKKSVDIAAPGSNILSTVLNNKFDSWSGTSMAAPHVSGVLALLKAKYPSDDYSDLKGRLIKGVTYEAPLKRKVANNGASLNAYKALSGQYSDIPFDPPEDSWSPLRNVHIASPSPYPLNYTESWELQHSGAKYIKIYFKQFEVEKGYDFLRLYDRRKQLVDELSGSYYDGLWSVTIPGDFVKLTLSTDKMISKKGFVVTGYKTSNAIAE
ncbi:S8 family serine peptidase [bacterium]|nr:S8 family serine peptidase [bacterium]